MPPKTRQTRRSSPWSAHSDGQPPELADDPIDCALSRPTDEQALRDMSLPKVSNIHAATYVVKTGKPLSTRKPQPAVNNYNGSQADLIDLEEIADAYSDADFMDTGTSDMASFDGIPPVDMPSDPPLDTTKPHHAKAVEVANPDAEQETVPLPDATAQFLEADPEGLTPTASSDYQCARSKQAPAAQISQQNRDLTKTIAANDSNDDTGDLSRNQMVSHGVGNGVSEHESGFEDDHDYESKSLNKASRAPLKQPTKRPTKTRSSSRSATAQKSRKRPRSTEPVESENSASTTRPTKKKSPKQGTKDDKGAAPAWRKTPSPPKLTSKRVPKAPFFSNSAGQGEAPGSHVETQVEREGPGRRSIAPVLTKDNAGMKTGPASNGPAHTPERGRPSEQSNVWEVPDSPNRASTPNMLKHTTAAAGTNSNVKKKRNPVQNDVTLRASLAVNGAAKHNLPTDASQTSDSAQTNGSGSISKCEKKKAQSNTIIAAPRKPGVGTEQHGLDTKQLKHVIPVAASKSPHHSTRVTRSKHHANLGTEQHPAFHHSPPNDGAESPPSELLFQKEGKCNDAEVMSVPKGMAASKKRKADEVAFPPAQTPDSEHSLSLPKKRKPELTVSSAVVLFETQGSIIDCTGPPGKLKSSSLVSDPQEIDKLVRTAPNTLEMRNNSSNVHRSECKAIGNTVDEEAPSEQCNASDMALAAEECGVLESEGAADVPRTVKGAQAPAGVEGRIASGIGKTAVPELTNLSVQPMESRSKPPIVNHPAVRTIDPSERDATQQQPPSRQGKPNDSTGAGTVGAVSHLRSAVPTTKAQPRIITTSVRPLSNGTEDVARKLEQIQPRDYGHGALPRIFHDKSNAAGGPHRVATGLRKDGLGTENRAPKTVDWEKGTQPKTSRKLAAYNVSTLQDRHGSSSYSQDDDQIPQRDIYQEFGDFAKILGDDFSGEITKSDSDVEKRNALTRDSDSAPMNRRNQEDDGHVDDSSDTPRQCDGGARQRLDAVGCAGQELADRLHAIVEALLARIKSKESAVSGVHSEYKKNASRLISQIDQRHTHELQSITEEYDQDRSRMTSLYKALSENGRSARAHFGSAEAYLADMIGE